jgi:quercetin dioxygenase-like cupin family protein
MNADEVMADHISHHVGGGVYVKETRIPAGVALVQHRHVFDHLAYLVSGRVEVLADDVKTTHEGPHCFTIPAGMHHGVKALTDAVWLCLWPESITDDEVKLEPAVDMEAMARSML